MLLQMNFPYSKYNNTIIIKFTLVVNNFLIIFIN